METGSNISSASAMIAQSLTRHAKCRLITNSAQTKQDPNFLADSMKIDSSVANDGDKYFFEFTLNGDETSLILGIYNNPNGGKFDVYINDIISSVGQGFSTYQSVRTLNYITIDLTQDVPISIKKGYNKVELRVNGKHVSSSDYVIETGTMVIY